MTSSGIKAANNIPKNLHFCGDASKSDPEYWYFIYLSSGDPEVCS